MADVVRVQHRYAASSERVFDAWIDPAVARRFLFATPSGQMLRCEIDPRVGGGFVIVERRTDVGDAETFGTYEVVDRPRRLVFQVHSPQYPGPVTRVSIEIAADGDGCRLTLIQEGLPADRVEPLSVGWTLLLEGLARALA